MIYSSCFKSTFFQVDGAAESALSCSHYSVSKSEMAFYRLKVKMSSFSVNDLHLRSNCILIFSLSVNLI